MSTEKQPQTEPITDLARSPELARILADGGSGQRHSMRGFDEQFTDIVDYIVRITHNIWEEGGVGLIYDYYGHKCPVHMASGTSYAREDVVTGTLKTLSAFPDRKLFAEDVIWSGDDVQGFHTSHRILNTATNTGYSTYGPPTGKSATWRGIANCYVIENRIVEEWLVRDELSLILQLGLRPIDILEKQFRDYQEPQIRPDPLGELNRGLGQLAPQPHKDQAGSKIEDFIRRNYHDLWNRRLFNRLQELYQEQFSYHGATGREFKTLLEYKAYLYSLFGMFPDLQMGVDHVYWLGDDDKYRVAVRWLLTGTHTGPGIYGEPTGARVHVMGISHHRIMSGKFVEEWTIFDEFELLKQIFRVKVKK